MIDTECTANIICPHCGYEDHDSWEVSIGSGNWDEGEGETDCPSCGATFFVERRVSIDYTTRKLSDIS